MDTFQEHPLLVSGPLVRAILSGEKTQTRRLIRRQPDADTESFDVDGDRWKSRSKLVRLGDTFPGAANPDRKGNWTDPVGIRCPFGQPGDRLWVRETWGYDQDGPHTSPVLFRADRDDPGIRWRPSIHMPRWASRISLEVTEVRVQRVQEISEADAQAEGVPAIPRLDGSDPRYYRQSFAALWDSLASAGQEWADNPWVWAVSFKMVQP